uniref:Uncharacterized protein n=1 Tax=Corethron hystrix TaxID=216773 RepID=A0A7S1FX04_9STRA
MIDGEARPALDKFHYVSGLSGGNVPSIMVAYAQNTTTDELLDVDGINHPTEITAEELDALAEKSVFKTLASSVVPYMPKALERFLLFGGNVFSNVVSMCCLETHGVERDAPLTSIRDEVKYTPVVETAMVGPSELYVEWLYNSANVAFGDAIVENGDLLQDSHVSSLPVKVNDNSVMWKNSEASGHQIPIPAFITPDTFHIPFDASTLKFDTAVDTVADPVHFAPVSSDPNLLQPKSEGKYTVQKFLAMGTNLLSILAHDAYEMVAGHDELGALLDTVNAPMLQDIPTTRGHKRSMAFTDGGYSDFSGIPALVKLGATKIVVPIFSTMTPERVLELGGPVGVTAYYLERYFGALQSPLPAYNTTYFDFTYAGGYISHIFDARSNGEDQMTKLRDGLTSLHRAGGPMVITLDKLEVVANPFWGIEAGGKVDLTIISVLDVPTKFSNQIDPAAAPPPANRSFTEQGYFTNEDLHDVPILASTGNIFELDIPDGNVTNTVPLPIELAVNPRGCKMTEILTSWIVREAWHELDGVTGAETFAGFKEIFGDVVDMDRVQTDRMDSTSLASDLM